MHFWYECISFVIVASYRWIVLFWRWNRCWKRWSFPATKACRIAGLWCISMMIFLSSAYLLVIIEHDHSDKVFCFRSVPVWRFCWRYSWDAIILNPSSYVDTKCKQTQTHSLPVTESNQCCRLTQIFRLTSDTGQSENLGQTTALVCCGWLDADIVVGAGRAAAPLGVRARV